MKKIFCTTLSVLTMISVFGQKTEYRLCFTSGLFSFAGQSAESFSSISYEEHPNSASTNNPYGSKQGLCYGISGNLKRISKRNFVFGIDLACERLRSKISISKINGHNGTSTYSYSAKGKTFLAFSFINLEPFAGYRFALNSLSFDITGGVDFGYCLRANENGSATATNGLKYKTSADRKTITIDARPRLQLSADYKKFGAYVGYSLGQVNYKSGYIGGINDCYSRLLRFGVTYLLH